MHSLIFDSGFVNIQNNEVLQELKEMLKNRNKID